ncbi:hypothetical protein [Mesorhizobium sp. WSM3860]|uniref:hypothetical protein n=1 Tax=Mesorhizobium sp. WSM3860 TaxID=2029403 RepID=UPI000BAF8A43|nr:hypothetical protein [Mesorhizobium sp. WSM3860]PBC01450.1 hypothetical protein CK220_25940 [Mesorhizobium sp. WSM3860]
MEHTRIAVIESNWWRKSNVSVRGLFDLIANMACENPNAYHYEMANSKAAMKEAIPRIGSYKECSYLYIATHGDWAGLVLLNGETFSRKALRDALVQIRQTPQSKLRGVHLGSCSFTTDRLAQFLYSADVGLKWIAGYTENVDWIESSALDLLFFNELMAREAETEGNVIRRVATKLGEVAPGLLEKLGFKIYVRKRGGGIANLLEKPESSDLIDV